MTGHKTIRASKVKAFDEFKSLIDLDNKKNVVKLLVEMFTAGDHDAFMEPP